MKNCCLYFTGKKNIFKGTSAHYRRYRSFANSENNKIKQTVNNSRVLGLRTELNKKWIYVVKSNMS